MGTHWRALGGVMVGVALLGASEHAAAQSFQGGLCGVVKDSQGIIPGVTVTLTNEGTGQRG